MKRVILFLNACLLCGHVIAGNDVELASTGDVQSVKTYKVGDYYNENGKEGVVFEVDATGRHGKIVSMKQLSTGLQWCIGEEYKKKVVINANNHADGMENMQRIMRIDGWREKYPAFVWCAEQGDGWYLPAIRELQEFTLDDAIHDAVNRTLSQYGGTVLLNKGEAMWYWSSTECIKGSAWGVSMYCGRAGDYLKYFDYFVRAVSVF